MLFQKLQHILTIIGTQNHNKNATIGAAEDTRNADMMMRAFVYRGPASCAGCPEAVAQLLQSTPNTTIDITYVGPEEKTQITAETLKTADIYAQPGGGDELDDTWKDDMKQYKTLIRNFVAQGGRYVGFCLGAYLAGYTPGFGLLPHGDDVDAETEQKGAQVRSHKDTVIQVDWHFATGEVQKKRWVYFQDGAVMDLKKGSNVKVLGRYSSNGDVAATLNRFGSGWVGLIGPHPEATEDWCEYLFFLLEIVFVGFC